MDIEKAPSVLLGDLDLDEMPSAEMPPKLA